MLNADWYFDFISPFAYLQNKLLPSFDGVLEITRRPVLFAGLLNRWGQLGPAEIPAKRVHTYRYCAWWAARHGIAFTMPPSHPFNPLHALRMAIAATDTEAAVDTIFHALYGEGRDLNDGNTWRAITARLDLADAEARIADPAVKSALKTNTDAAAEAGVFGVPTFVVEGELFWGLDATEMLRDFIADRGLFATPEHARYATLPISAQRRRPQ